MANKIVKDSFDGINVKTIAVPQSTQINDIVRSGGKAGLAGDAPRLGEDGLYYVPVDTAALIRVDAIAIAFTDGAPVFITSGNVITATQTGNFTLGYADRAKSAASGPLFVQLKPGVTVNP